MSFGTDFKGVDDIDANWSFETNDRRVLAEDLARALQMPRGALWYAPDRGYDVRSLVADTGPDPSTAEQAIEAECLKDERVQSCQCTITVSADQWTIEVRVTPSDADAFTLILGVTSVTVTILSVGA